MKSIMVILILPLFLAISGLLVYGESPAKRDMSKGGSGLIGRSEVDSDLGGIS